MYIHDHKSILSISQEINYPPYFITRLLLQHLLAFENKKIFLNKCTSGDWDVTYGLIGHVDGIPFAKDGYRKSEYGYDFTYKDSKMSRLAYEVLEAVNTDPMYGLFHDRVRNNIGYEHEIMLQNILNCIGKCVVHYVSTCLITDID